MQNVSVKTAALTFVQQKLQSYLSSRVCYPSLLPNALCCLIPTQFTVHYKILMVSYYNLVLLSVMQSSRLLEQALSTAGILPAEYKNKEALP